MAAAQGFPDTNGMVGVVVLRGRIERWVGSSI
jgi:hypothetical protein